MFHGTIIMGGKGPATFWEKDWGTMDSYKYDAVILNNIEAFYMPIPIKTLFRYKIMPLAIAQKRHKRTYGYARSLIFSSLDTLLI
jgi:hypothetical protein